MTWVRVDDTLPSHPKFLGADDPIRAIGVFVTGLCYSNLHLTDGFLPEAAVRSVAGVDASLTCRELVKAGLWVKVSGGFRIHHIEQYQPSKAKVTRRRKQAKVRQKKWLRGVAQIRKRDASITTAPIPSHPVPVRTKRSKDLLAGFEDWYQVYPLHQARPKAEKAWGALKPTAELQAIMIAAVAQQKAAHAESVATDAWCPAWPHPASWLNARRWEDQSVQQLEERSLAGDVYRELYRAMPPAHRAWLVGAEKNGDGIVRLHVVSTHAVEPFRARLEAALGPGARLEITESKA